MADLTFSERKKLEQLFNMSGGYVLDFVDRTFREFVRDCTALDIHDAKYMQDGASKARRLRAFWTLESNHQVGRLVMALVDHRQEMEADGAPPALVQACRQVGERLVASAAVDAADALSVSGGRDLERLAAEVRRAIDRNEPEVGLDRLHTYVVKFVRQVAEKRGVACAREKPLHSIFGEYVKVLGKAGCIESTMTQRILKSSISTLEAFNEVRNEKSLAHDNPILNRAESILIVENICAVVRFLRAIESEK